MRASPWLMCLFAIGCTHGWTQTATLGPTFGAKYSAVVLAIEVSAVAHQAFPARTATSPGDPHVSWEDMHGPSSKLGIAATASTGAVLGRALGGTGFAAIGADFLPFVYASGALVGFGGQVAVAAGAQHGLYAVAPRLWFAVPLTRLRDAPVSLGLMLRCQFAIGDATGCGPSVVVTRVDL